MVINNDDVIRLFEQLPEKAKQSAIDYILYLSVQGRPDWNDIAQLDSVSEEEMRQLNSDEGFITGEIS